MRSTVPLYGHIAGALPRSLVERIYAWPALTRAIRSGIEPVVPRDEVEEEVLAGPLRGARLPIFPRNEVSFVSGLWEYWVSDALCEHLSPGNRAWDVGAYVGYFTLLMRQCCGPDRVLAVEPDPSILARLKRTLDLNGARDVDLVEAAVGSHEGRIALAGLTGHPAASTSGSGGFEVSVTTLDTLAAARPPPDLVKLDVEGDEARVLEGASGLLRDVRPLWVVELHGSGGIRAQEILRGHGYRIRRLNPRASATHQEHILAVP